MSLLAWERLTRCAVIGIVALFIAVVPASGNTGEHGSGSWPADQDPDTVSLTDAPLPPRSDVSEVSLTCTSPASPGF